MWCEFSFTDRYQNFYIQRPICGKFAQKAQNFTAYKLYPQ